MRRLVSYSRAQYAALIDKLAATGYELKSALEFSNSEQIAELLSKERVAIDVSSLASLFESNPHLAATIEFLLHQTSVDVVYIAEENAVGIDAFVLRTLFSSIEKCGIEAKEDSLEMPCPTRTLATLSEPKCEEVLNSLDRELIGQSPFKVKFRSQVRSFRLFNRIGEQPILSLLLIGPSGIGKTEVAKILCEAIAPGQPFPKINFGNYSSKDSLNSLIGSPRGYIGSEEGELAIKVSSSKAGILLVDEFEKAEPAVWSFFLDLLETGSYTDSQGSTHDLTGYTIVFTSNCPSEELEITFPPELLSRFNLKAKFATLTTTEKETFIKRYIDRVSAQYANLNDATLPVLPSDMAIRAQEDIDVSGIDNIRILKNQARSWFVDTVDALTKIENFPTGHPSV